VLPYDLVTPLFTDYAHKLRTVWMPRGQPARYSADEEFDFPVGTILSKTFYYPRGTGDTVLRSNDAGPDLRGGGLDLSRVRLVETRLLVRRKDGWVALPYVWNAQQTEATLKRGGELVPLTLVAADGSREQAEYEVPDQNQCGGCHGIDTTSKALHPLGPKARHLNHDFPYAQGSENQLLRWANAGFLAGAPAPASAPRDANWNDPSQPLEARARAYLDINCGQHFGPVAECGEQRTAAPRPLQVADRRGHGHRRPPPRRGSRPAGRLDPRLPDRQRRPVGDDAGAGA
jgi:uncharacterized repeat protein (TIGR03806 family)